MSYYRCKYPIVFNYEILGNPLERLNEIRHLGVVFDRTLSFARHVDLIIAKAYSMLIAWFDENMR